MFYLIRIAILIRRKIVRTPLQQVNHIRQFHTECRKLLVDPKPYRPTERSNQRYIGFSQRLMPDLFKQMIK